jgi:hypothetical protein
MSKKERKALAKKLGLVKKKESYKEMVERFRRAQEFGKMLHLQHLQNIQNEQNKTIESEKELVADPISEIQDQEELKKIFSGETKEG